MSLIIRPGPPSIVPGSLTVGGQILAADGSAGAPSIAPASDPDTGFFYSPTQVNTLFFSSGGNSRIWFRGGLVQLGSTGGVAWGADPSPLLVTATDLSLARSGVGSLTIGDPGNGQLLGIKLLTQLVTIAAAADTDTTIQIPQHALVLGVSARVTTVIPTATVFDLGVTGATTRYGTGISAAATTTHRGTNDAVRYYAAATAIKITPDVQPAANTGRVRVTIHFLDVTPPTS